MSDKNIFQTLGFDAEESAELKLKASLMTALDDWIKTQPSNQVDIAQKLDITPVQVDDIRNGKISQLSLKQLLVMADKANLHIHVSAIPANRNRTDVERQALRKAANQLTDILESHGVDEEQLVAEFKQLCAADKHKAMTIDPEVERLSGLVPTETDARADYHHHLIKKHR